jgi:hypothetical protein
MPAASILLWLCAVAAGSALRLHQIHDQVLVDDEWHALHALLAGGPLDVLRSFGATDHSIPLTLYDMLLERTVGLTELGMRLPSLVAGIATLVVVPWLLRDAAGTRASVVLAWLLAIAPLHVFFSRYARPYEPAMLASAVALLGLYRAGREERPWLRRAALAGAIAAPWLLPVVLPVVATALAVATLEALRARRGGAVEPRRTRNALAGIGLVAVAWLLLLGLPLLGDAAAIGDKVGRGTLRWATLAGASELLFGTASLAPRAACGAAVLAGSVVLLRRAPRLAAWLAVVAAAQVVALVVAAPHGLRFPIVLARYLFVLSPFLLLLLALGIDAADAALSQRFRPSRARLPLVATASVAVLFLAGPLRWIDAYPNDFSSHASYQADYRPERYFESFRPARVSAFYEQLAREPAGSRTVVEAPWYFYWHGLAWLQRLHGQHVVVGFVDPARDAVRVGEVPRDRDGIRLRNALHVDDLPALRARGVDYVIFHHDVHAEMRVPFADVPVDVRPWIEQYRRDVGAPVFEDASITVFALEPAAR